MYLRISIVFFFVFCFSIYTPQKLPNTRARRGLIKIKELGTCTEHSVCRERRLGIRRFPIRLHLDPGRVERVINPEIERCRFRAGCSGPVLWGFVGRRVRRGVIEFLESRGVLGEEDEGVGAR